MTPKRPTKLSFQRRFVNAFMFSLTFVCTFIAVGLLFFILGYLLVKGGASLSWDFFTKLPAPVGETGGGVANALIGSAKVLLIAMSIGVPIGFLAGIYLAEYANAAFASLIRFVTDLLNGVPSIVVGIFAYALIVVRTGGFSAYAGGIALGIMMIPIALRSTEEFLRAVPLSLREGAMALGAKKYRTISTVVVPAAIRGLISGMMLNLARVAGETAPLLFTALNNQFWSPGWSQPTATLPVMIFNYAIAPYPEWHQYAWAGGFVLLSLVLLVNITARSIVARGMASKTR
jgi:phosphate transport system permease protein